MASPCCTVFVMNVLCNPIAVICYVADFESDLVVIECYFNPKFHNIIIGKTAGVVQ